jgi:hypothetical protein
MPAWWRKRIRIQAEQATTDDDVLVESVVLAYIVNERPEGVTIPMLAVRFNAEFDQGDGGSAVERAVRELVCDGRLRMQRGKVVPYRPGWGVFV